MAKADESRPSDVDIVVKAMADKICEEIDNDLKKTLEAEVIAAQKQYPYPYVTWNEDTSSYKTITVDLSSTAASTADWTAITSSVGKPMTVGTAGQVFYIQEVKTVGTTGWATTTATVVSLPNKTLAPTPKTDDERLELYDGLTKDECLSRYERQMRGEDMLKSESLTLLQLEVAKAEWSFRLKVKVAESQKITQHQVLVDLDLDD